MLDKLVQGFNSTIFAYGQSGAGKSFTTFGKEPVMYLEVERNGKMVQKWLPIKNIELPPVELQGLIPRSTAYMFGWIQSKKSILKSASVAVGFYEIYLTGLRDLLSKVKKQKSKTEVNVVPEET